MPIDLYHCHYSATSNAVLMCLRQLSLDVNVKNIYDRSGDHLTPEYEKLNPTQTVPTIVDNDLVLWESRAILRYLANAYAPNTSLYPSEPKRRAIVDKVLDFSYGFHQSFKAVKLASNGTEATPQQMDVLNNNMKVIDTLIGANEYVTGSELTIADLSVLATTQLLLLLPLLSDKVNGYPNYSKWFERMKTSLPYYKEIFG